jgi:putative transposase
MGRIPRRFLVSDGSVNHCTWRSHNFHHCLGSDEAKTKFLALLAAHKDEHGIEIYSYSLMNSHPHVQSRSRYGQRTFSRFWQVVNYRFARWYNARHGRRGQVVMERMSSGLVQDSNHQLAVMRYGDLNPVRAGLAPSAKHWRWSSYRHYAFGARDGLITDAPAYLALGVTAALRRKAYVQLFTDRRAAPFKTYRRDLVILPFIGADSWIRTRLRELLSRSTTERGRTQGLRPILTQRL